VRRNGRTLMRDQTRTTALRIALANVGYAQALYLSYLIILPDRAAAIGGHEDKSLVLAVVAAAGAVIGLPASIVVGRFSDRRMESSGSRRPVLTVVALAGAASLVVLPFARSVLSLLLAWGVTQISLNCVITLITAALVDWFGRDLRGNASAYAATGQVAGALIASGLVLAIGSSVDMVGVVSGVVLLLTALPAAFHRHSAGSLPVACSAPPGSVRGSYRDVRLAFAVRGVVTFANTLVITFANFYVTDVLHLHDPQHFIGLAAGVTAALVLVGAVYSGRASDRAQRRRRFVIRAVLFMCLGEVLLAAWRSALGVLVGCALIGFGYGVYLSVDQALTADVLPDSQKYGRDVGIMITSASVPQVAAPVLAAFLLGASASYYALFSVGALITLSGAAFVAPIRTVR
jgi:MFS family permease